MSYPTYLTGWTKFAEEIDAELKRQREKWGEQNHPPILWCAILGEEYGETCKAALELKSDELKKELIQVAAVAIATLQSIERKEAQDNKATCVAEFSQEKK